MSTLDLSGVRWRKSSRSAHDGGDCVEVAGLDTARWHKSSHSGGDGGQCVEVAGLDTARWHKSSHSAHDGGQCVEVAGLAPVVAIRDSKNPDGPKLILDAAAWRAFTHRIKAHGHDLA